jgi:uncharacterized surface protein with fasciclin (FAS1) repeats
MDSRPLLAVIVIVAGLCVVGTFAGDTFCYFNANQTGGTNAATAWTSDTWSESTTAEFNAGVPINADTTGDQVKLTLSPPPAYVYALRGNGATAFWRYDITANTWATMSPVLGTINDGGAMVYTGGDYIYALRGGLTRNFYRYSISGNSWSSMALAPATVGAGGSLAFDGTYIYALRGGNTRNFWRYNIASNTWSSLGNIPRSAYSGAALTYAGGYVYGTRGATLKDFYRYNIGTGAWSTRQSLASGYEPGPGAALSNNGTHLFMLVGEDKYFDENKFDIYTIATNTWTYSTTPFFVDPGGALASDSTAYVYALRGYSSTGFWRYSTAARTWASRAATPGTVAEGGSLVYVASTGSACYASPGSVASVVFDTSTANSRWDMLAWNATIPSGTAISFEVRASNTPFLKDASSPAWTSVTGSFVNGKYVVAYPNLPSGRYHQWRATLSSSLCPATPTLYDATVYYSDWVTPVGGMSGLMSLATGFASQVDITGGAEAPVEIPAGIVDPNSLFIEPDPAETPAPIAAGNATNMSETPVPMDALKALNATANATQTEATLIPVNATTVPIDTRAANVTANLTPAANVTANLTPTATMASNATANVTQIATTAPTPDLTAVPIVTVATTPVPTATMPTATPTTMAPLTLLEVASTDRNLTTFVNLTRQAGLDSLLSGPGPYTVFAPTDDAFKAMPPSYLAGLLADPASLAQVLNRHIVEGGLGTAELAGASTIRTLGGTDVNMTARNGIVKVGGGTVNYTDTQAGNGVIHVIDAVIPPAETPVPRAAPSTATVAQTWTPLPVVTTPAVTTEATTLPQTTATARTTPTTRGKHYLT